MSNNVKLPDGITCATLQENWDTAQRLYTNAFKRIRMLDAADKGRLWESIGSKFPSFQILPDTNHISRIKQNLLASIYCVGKAADVLPTSPDDKPLVFEINKFLAYFWAQAKVTNYQTEAGERAALCNLGITQVGWDAELSGGSGDFAYKGGPVLRNIDPTRFMRDPYAIDLENSGYCMTWEILHRDVLSANPLYADRMKAYKDDNSTTGILIEKLSDGPTKNESRRSKNNYMLIVHWVRTPEGIAEIHTLDNKYVLHCIPQIKPNTFPFALLYCNLPAGDLIGVSEPSKVFANTVAYNLLNSILLTAEFKSQNPPVFIAQNSGLNIPNFIKHANDANTAFVVSGDASKTVHYQVYPQANQTAIQLMSKLPVDIDNVSGVDGRYTGRDTGSILTTGGIEAMLDQVTLIDAPKVTNYEAYTLRLTKLILGNMCEHSAVKRKHFVKDQNSTKFSVIEVDFAKIKSEDIFTYEISISSSLPKNRSRIAQMANTMMEKQMQYAQSGQKVDIITPEEWLYFQDLPLKELMQDRMGIQRNTQYTERVSEILFTFAELVKGGATSGDAISAVADMMQAKDHPLAPEQSVMQEMPDMPEAAQSPLMQGLGAF